MRLVAGADQQVGPRVAEPHLARAHGRTSTVSPAGTRSRSTIGPSRRRSLRTGTRRRRPRRVRSTSTGSSKVSRHGPVIRDGASAPPWQSPRHHEPQGDAPRAPCRRERRARPTPSRQPSPRQRTSRCASYAAPVRRQLRQCRRRDRWQDHEPQRPIDNTNNESCSGHRQCRGGGQAPALRPAPQARAHGVHGAAARRPRPQGFAPPVRASPAPRPPHTPASGEARHPGSGSSARRWRRCAGPDGTGVDSCARSRAFRTSSDQPLEDLIADRPSRVARPDLD